jgi:hypothetical protein
LSIGVAFFLGAAGDFSDSVFSSLDTSVFSASTGSSEMRFCFGGGVGVADYSSISLSSTTSGAASYLLLI